MNPRALRLAGPAILVGTALLALIAGLAFGGGSAPLVIGDPGPLVRWGLPLAELVVNLSAALLVGSLVLALFALVAGTREFDLALDAASAGAAILTLAAGTTAYLTFQNSFPTQVSADAAFGAQLGRFLVDTEPGRAWLLTTIAAAVLTVLTFAVRGWLPTLLVGLLAVAAMVPMATAGHTGSEANHNTAVTSLALHIIAAAAWLGGLLLIVLLRPVLGRDRLADVLGRYSSIALAAFVVVTLSGIARAVVGIVTFEHLFSPYGALLMVKVAALIAMGVLGAFYRRRLISRIRDAATAARFWLLVGVEVAFMGIASGAAVALSVTPPPVDTALPTDSTPAEVLTGSVLPPELTLTRYVTQWDVDLLWAFAVGFGLFFYLAGVRRLAARGDRWPVWRTVLWVFGLLLLLYVTCGPVNAYQDYLFSMHMVGHMLLSMAIPMCLVFGAPVTLASRAIRKRDDGTRGGREWILWAVHSPYARVITHPLVAAALFIVSLWAFYYTDLFRWTLYEHLGHEWMIVHFLTTGYLFVLSLVGIDPVPYRLPHAGRLLTLIGVMAMHAFFGIAIMMSSGLFVAEWFGSMGRTWGLDPLADQYLGGGIAWSIGEIPTLILAIVVAVQWSRSDERRQRSADRHAERTGDAELAEYNARLAKIAERDARDAARR
ncbi:cytochrome c oxidase assembly protein [Microbacterium sp. EYE_5]|uniref:cytochrome c oxidase assembly protein n=1 Tax=unclassified Microbacterium TaxID=2609290 RepID=UPI0020043543|nr:MULTISPECIES: cytochrome c oxidase assembly protein [unclassified Microbacterium]MCK6079444.1 cytochrome c oxidase assembly protein [Microbacterium sp. EYE_382]MCK6084714.1 cytochrome c oxidase assembly protein [Microbacterium sp. EYE_384]MCK6123059.1 cytochrome c oxidase assembly protein [Microbacterium sp. EYE_80]MCK6125478.1 cytochrome c oxidase assembly protein [Microbacterium sp. EYE_79]MCK6140398.1 cytochrome c oxidase assembly protein [Microbacterium sp. EYE_39]